MARSGRRALGALVRKDPDEIRRAAVYLSHHGALTCTDRDPHCRVCPLVSECAWASAQRSRQSEI
jgi:adenine-specific DNA glycosylase